MEMTGLRDLHQSMIQIAADIQQFHIRAGAADFDCLFLTRGEPFLFSLTSRGANPKFFSFNVELGYRINTFLGDRYQDLVDVLYVDGRAGKQLQPNVFFHQVNEGIPRIAHTQAIPKPEDIVRLRHDLEDRDRPYFDRWEQRGRGPSPRNKEKTLAVLGHDALQHSIRVNMSSIWSVEPTGRAWR